MLCSWEGMDTDRRGTWIKKVGGEQKRICDEPFLAANNLAPVLVLKDAGLAVFQTKKGLQKIRLDGSGLQSFVGSPMNVGRLSIIGRVP